MLARTLHLSLLLIVALVCMRVRAAETRVGVTLPAGVDGSLLARSAHYQTPVLADRSSVVDHFVVTKGHLRVEFLSGTATPLRVGDAIRGLYLKGVGQFQYQSVDPVVHPLLRFNLKENTRILPGTDGAFLTVGEPVTEAIVWFLGGQVPALPPPTEPAPKEAFHAALAYSQARATSLPSGVSDQLTQLPICELAAYEMANDPTKRVEIVDLAGAEEHWVYTYDPVRSHLESLVIQRPKVMESGAPFTDQIAVDWTPLGWTRKAPLDPDFRLSHVDLDLVASTKAYAKLKVVETLRVIHPGLRMLSFRLQQQLSKPKLFKKAEPLKSPLQKVTLDGRQELAFMHQGGFLLVDLGRPAKNGETLQLTFEAEGDMISRDPAYEYWRLTPGENWFPVPDLAGQGYTLKARVAVEKPFIAIVSAKTVARSSTATQNVVEARLDKPMCWFSIAAGKYTSEEMIRNGRVVRAWGYSGIGKGASQLLKTTHGILEFYAELFGTSPFDEVNLVEVPSLGFGQAPSGMIWLTREAFDAISDPLNRLVAGNGAVGGWVNRMVAHELAHQYWGSQLKMWGYEDQWLTESFAEYCSALAMRQMKNKGKATYELIVKDWADQAKRATLAATIPTANLIHPAERGGAQGAERFRQELVYSKGAYLLACLHQELGEREFIHFLRLYLDTFPWYPPSYSQDVPDLLKKVSGKNFQPWMDKYFYGTDLPPWRP